MVISFTQHTLEKLEKLVEKMGYKIRYEKGNFRTGTCILERSKIIVVNKFSNLESKILALIELIPHLEIDETLFDSKQRQFFYSFKNYGTVLK